MVGIKVVSTGHTVPDKVVTNDDLSRVVDTNDEWIYSKTGIKERHFCENETNWELALKAADTAIERAGIDKSEIGMLIVATFTPDYATPSIACVLHEKWDLERIFRLLTLMLRVQDMYTDLKSQHHFFRTVKRDMLSLLEANRFPPVLTWRTEIHVYFLAMEQELPL